MDNDDESLQMHLLHDYKTLPSKKQILYKLLLESIESKDIKTFTSLIDQALQKQRPILNLNYNLPNCTDETLLDITCKKGLSDFVEHLLKRGAKVNRISEAHNRAPIHFAVDNGHVDVLEVLLKDPEINPNLEAGQRTALHISVKKKDLITTEILLENGASPNIPNSKGLTALHMAAKARQRDMVDLILRKSKYLLDLDKYRDAENRSTRELIQKNFPDILLPDGQETNSNIHDLKYYLNANDEVNFLKCLEDVQEEVNSNVAKELIEMAVQRKFENSIRALLKIIRNMGCNLETAASIAIQKGYPDILQELLNADNDIGNNLILEACLELGVPGSKGAGDMNDHVECLKILLDKDDVDVRVTDSKGNTPLHYAARAGCREAIELLLEKGSYIGHMNNFGVPPVADIPGPILSEYFDDCLETKRERSNEYTIEFNYRCLMPHNAHSYKVKDFDASYAKGEMDVFRYIARNNALKHLLKHPLLSSFLYLKWRRVRYIFFIDFAVYVLFYLFLNWFILQVNHSGSNEMNNSISSMNSSVSLVNDSNISNESNATDALKMAPVSDNVLKFFTAITLILFIIKEILRLVSAPCHYIHSFQNWLGLIIIGLGIAILNGAGTEVAAIVILISAWELVLMMGQFPRMSTAIEMFQTVSCNFLRFLFLYAFLILAFAFAFFTLFKKGDEFPDAGHSLFKTFIMLTGEFEAKELPYNYYPILSRLIFALFVFLIAIVLFNLLNGLAVSDTRDILHKAELVALVSRTELISHVESIAVRSPFISQSCYSRINCHPPKCKPLGFLFHRVLLFPSYLKTGRLSVKPECFFDEYDVKEHRHQHTTVFREDEEDKVVPTSKLDSHIIKEAKMILSNKGRASDSQRILGELNQMKDRLLSMEITLNTIKLAVDNNNLNASSEARMSA